MAVSYYATPVLGLLVLIWKMRRDGLTAAAILVLAFLATAIAVSIWQVRGSMFAMPLATIPLSAWIGEWRARVAAGGGTSTTLKMALAWIVSLNVAWSASANAIAGAVGAPLSPGGGERSAGTCDRGPDFVALAALPATTVLAISNLGAPILAIRIIVCSPGPTIATSPATSWRSMPSWGLPTMPQDRGRTSVGLVALCRGNTESAALTRDGAARLSCRPFCTAPCRIGWRIPGVSGEPLEIYRVGKAP